MTPATLNPEREALWPNDPGQLHREAPPYTPPPAPPTPPQRPTGKSPRKRPPIAVLLLISALLGGGTAAGAMEATRGKDRQTTTVIQQAASGTSSTVSSKGGLNATALYNATSAGVVDITVKTSSTSSQQQSPFGGVPRQQSQEATATGTGFVYDKDGHIATAAHVVDDATSITVKLADGTTRSATVLGKDDATDVAVIKIDPTGLTLHPLTLGSSAGVNVGAQLAVVGDPFGYARSISTGIVSGVDRTIQAPNGFTVAHAIQTDAAMNPGNSGGPVLDANGKVIGISDQIATNGSADQSAGVGFAVPIDIVKSVLSTLESGGKVQHAYLGVASGDSSSATAGATIGDISSGGPAAAAGLRSGDIVTKFGADKVTNSNDLVAAIASHQPGDRVDVTVNRDGKTQTLSVTLGTQPAQSAQSQSQP